MDIRQFTTAAANLPTYAKDWLRYRSLPNAERLSVMDAYPCLLDRTASTPFDSHYYYLNAWALRRILTTAPKRHVDMGSSIVLSSLLSAYIPTIFLDYRPLNTSLTGLSNVGGDLRRLPFKSGSVASASILHVAEHIGLGRYGDELDPSGTSKAAAEVARVLSHGGNLFFAVPVGRPRVCFNAHRILDPVTTVGLFPSLVLVECSGVTDSGQFREKVEPESLRDNSYACGMFWFKKPSK